MEALMQWVEKYLKQPVARLLMQWGVTPNMLTLFGLTMTMLASIVLVTTKEVWLAGVIFLIGTLADFFDGAVARLQPGPRDFHFGGWLDVMSDRTGEIFLCGAISIGYFADQKTQMLSFAAFAAGFLLSFVKAAAGEKGVVVDWSEKAILGYPGRVVILVVGMLSTFFLSVPDETILALTVTALLLFNVPVLVLRVGKVVRAKVV